MEIRILSELGGVGFGEGRSWPENAHSEEVAGRRPSGHHSVNWWRTCHHGLQDTLERILGGGWAS